jgi:hypothetical protein
MPFAADDYRSSKVRQRSARTGDPALRLVYLEMLLALWVSGGELPADPDLLADELLLPADEIARVLPILSDMRQKDPHGRGGLQVSEGSISNPRVTEDLAENQRFREKQADLGRRGGVAKAKRSRSGRQAIAKRTLSPLPSPPLPSPSIQTTSGGSPESAPESKPGKTPQQRLVDDAWAIYDGVSAKRPAAGLVVRWCKELFRSDAGWMLRALEELSVRGYLAKGDAYVFAALSGTVRRSKAPGGFAGGASPHAAPEIPAADVERPVLWPRIAQRLRATLGDEVFDGLFAPLGVRVESPHEILLVAADVGSVETIERDFRLALECAARDEFGEAMQVFVTCSKELSEVA